MKKLFKAFQAGPADDDEQERKLLAEWKARNFLDNSPQFVKEQIFLRYGIPDAQWVETGTYLGETTAFLAQRFSFVHSIEPAPKLFAQAEKKFAGRNVKLHNNVSEVIFPTLLPTLTGDINFWLDGHYSAGKTFKGETDCPVDDELAAIDANLGNFDQVTILIDDIRCFVSASEEYADYPSLDSLVDWARAHAFAWRIEHDILAMTRH